MMATAVILTLLATYVAYCKGLNLYFIERNSPLRNARASKREKRDQGIARMFIIIVIIFFICNTPRMILNSVEVLVLATGREFSEGWPAW